MGTVTLTPDTASYLDRVEQPLQSAEPFEWLNLEGLTESAALVERGLSEVEGIQGCGLGQTRKAAVVGTDMLGLLATLVLRLRGAAVVTLGRVPQGVTESEPSEGNRRLETCLDEFGPDAARGGNRRPVRQYQ